MPGQIVHCVMARQDTNEPNRLIAASIGLARPADPNKYGYLSEHHSYGETAKKAGDYAEDLAATMLATTLGIEFDPEKAWNEREQVFKLEKTHPQDAQRRAERRGPRQGAVVHGRRARRLHLLERPTSEAEPCPRSRCATRSTPTRTRTGRKMRLRRRVQQEALRRRAEVPGVEAPRLEGRRREDLRARSQVDPPIGQPAGRR